MLFADESHDSISLRELNATILIIGKIREIKAQGMLDVCPRSSAP
jgi:hypothetical protein